MCGSLFGRAIEIISHWHPTQAAILTIMIFTLVLNWAGQHRLRLTASGGGMDGAIRPILCCQNYRISLVPAAGEPKR
jgi:hypothetical protein